MTSTNNKTRWDFEYIRVEDGGSFYPQGLNNTDENGNSNPFPFDKSAKKVRFEYDDDYNIYLRGNGDKSWLGIKNGEFTIVDNKAEAVPIRIYALSDNTPISVIYHDVNGEQLTSVDTQKYFTLMRMSDKTIDDTQYTFLGWTTDEKFKSKPYLSLADSCNLYDYDDETDAGSYKPDVKEKYSLVGSGNPDVPDSVNLNDYLKNGEFTLKLYPLYAVRGYDTVVTANDNITRSTESTPVVSISDWKPLQGEDGYYNPDKEKWLGSVNIEVYKDGATWVTLETIYFSYHNDDAVDLNIKFIWDSIVDAAPYNGDIKAYMSDNDLFPEYDQIGHFVLDAAYAEQGGSEDGLKYNYNRSVDSPVGSLTISKAG